MEEYYHEYLGNVPGLCVVYTEDRQVGNNFVTDVYLSIHDFRDAIIDGNWIQFKNIFYLFAIDHEGYLELNLQKNEYVEDPVAFANVLLPQYMEKPMIYGFKDEPEESYVPLPDTHAEEFFEYGEEQYLPNIIDLRQLDDLSLTDYIGWYEKKLYYFDTVTAAVVGRNILIFDVGTYQEDCMISALIYHAASCLDLGTVHFYFQKCPTDVEVIAPEYLDTSTLPLDSKTASDYYFAPECLFKLDDVYATRYLYFDYEEGKKLENKLLPKMLKDNLTFLGPIYIMKPTDLFTEEDMDLSIEIRFEGFFSFSGDRTRQPDIYMGKEVDGKLYILAPDYYYQGNHYLLPVRVYELIPTGIKANNVQMKRSKDEIVFYLTCPRSY